jgi:hypothetical protein
MGSWVHSANTETDFQPGTVGKIFHKIGKIGSQRISGIAFFDKI